MISYNKLCEKYNHILYTTILFTLYSAPPLPSARSAHVRLVPRHLVFRKRLIAHVLCLAHPDFKIRLGHFPFAHTGKIFFIRPLVDLPNIVVVNFLFEAFCCAYFAQVFPPCPGAGSLQYEYVAPGVCKNQRRQFAQRFGTKSFCSPFISST